MKNLKLFFAITLLATLAFSCKNESTPEIKTVEVNQEAKEKTLDPNATYAKAEFTIEGMTCAIGCAKTIEKKLSNTEGIKSATVDFDKRLAMVEYDEAKVNTTTLEETVAKAGDMYSVKDMKTVNSFSNTKACAEDCKMPCCAEKTETEKAACKADCKMPCCAEKV
ncbi:heavy-metal-associated domain-containing protein [Formosa sp. S-31]|uniref:heavy-metal-associated domain-containing protein n=1 Tax=Formosa sp. S-31 TaxID=2790949 RepID=UPI003EBA0B42